jgi:Kef-type K+ transport system membrane component KefB/nucleotide-binding universal stress UspA family protein
MVLAILGASFVLALSFAAHAAEGQPQGPSEIVFLCQIVALLACGRLMGEVMQRIRQPAVMGQLLAGILLGPTVLGALWPAGQRALFPAGADQKAMLDAVAQLGILLLLLLTGMETDLSVVRRSRRAAFSTSIFGIALPFLCGFALGDLLPDALLPDPGKRLITTLFLGVALSISSVKIVAMVVREVGFLRRTLGQVIVAAAIIDDTIGWIVMSVVFGLASHGAIDLWALGQSLLGTALFLGISFTIGRQIVFRLIRWANDQFVSELPVITMILVITGLMALTTNAIGVHTVLGAFIAGILIGQSPILTRHIDEQMRGMIVALFMPVFFGLAGLSTNLTALANTDLLLLTIGLIVIASLGKFGGAFLGGRMGGMSWGESIALGCGMNARGSTEVIIATIGLSMGVLNQNLFTIIVAMAVVTTMSMPPLLRWALSRLPITEEEAERLKREEFEETGFVPQIERMLVAVDASPSGQFASRMAGLLAGARQMATTVLHFNYVSPDEPHEGKRQAARTRAVVKENVAEGDDASQQEGGIRAAVTTRIEEPDEAAITAEAEKGYGFMVIGREPASERGQFHPQIAASAAAFSGPFAVTIARGIDREEVKVPRPNILVPVTGTAISRRGAEFAISLAQASRGSVTALHFVPQSQRPATVRSWQRGVKAAIAPMGSANAVIREIVRLGDPYGIVVRPTVQSAGTSQDAILHQIRSGGHNLVVMGVSIRPGEQLDFGQTAAGLLDKAECSLMFVVSEQPTTVAGTPVPSKRKPSNSEAGRNTAFQELAK